MNKKKKYLLVAILLMAIGFATVATSIYINGTATIGQNLADFDVKFTKAIQNETDVSSEVISADGKTLVYTTKDLAMINDEDELVYTVTNNSTQYDASISINCTNGSDKYLTLSNTIDNNIVAASSSVDGSVIVKLKKEYAEEEALEVAFSCTLTVDAIERTSTATPSVIEAGNVAFTPSNPNWNVNSVEDALDYLFENN